MNVPSVLKDICFLEIVSLVRAAAERWKRSVVDVICHSTISSDLGKRRENVSHRPDGVNFSFDPRDEDDEDDAHPMHLIITLHFLIRVIRWANISWALNWLLIMCVNNDIDFLFVFFPCTDCRQEFQHQHEQDDQSKCEWRMCEKSLQMIINKQLMNSMSEKKNEWVLIDKRQINKSSFEIKLCCSRAQMNRSLPG